MEYIAKAKEFLQGGRTFLGIELGSTRIKASLIGADHAPIAAGSYTWENRYENGIWTYSLDEAWSGLQSCYRDLAADVQERYGVPLTTVGAIGISGMMHGYLPFNASGRLLTPFRTWRNTITERSAAELTREFNFNIPQRWSIAHLYQAILNGEGHVKEVSFLTTLAGYLHWLLTGEKVIGIGEASGMFPIDSAVNEFDASMLDRFDALVAPNQYPWHIRDILPKVLTAGEHAGTLTAKGALLLDPIGALRPGIPFCPPEGDAGTGMTATNAVAVRTGNVSAGTSIFAMIVLEQPLLSVYPQIDMVTTPTGKQVAMVHCNNCTTEVNAWVNLFKQALETMGHRVDIGELYGTLYHAALEGDVDCGGLLLYNYHSGEPITGFEEGRPLFVRTAESKFTLPNFMRAQLMSSLASLKIGMDLLRLEENVTVDKLMGHGGFFKTPVVGQRLMAAAANTTVSVMETAGEGGPWGMALLAAYMVNKEPGEALETYLDKKVFVKMKVMDLAPDAADVAGFKTFNNRYEGCLSIERTAIADL